MILSAFIFVAVLFVIGVGCIWLVRGSFKNDTELAARDDNPARSRFRPEMTSQQALIISARAEARREAAEQRAERWKNLTPSLVNQAFRNFYEGDKDSAFDASLVSAAFEKFTKETKRKH